MNTQTLTPAGKTIVGVQFLFVAFGSTVLVPLLIGLDPATALLTAGVGTFIFHLVTKGVVPIFLGSSFAFIAPIKEASKLWGMPGTIAGIAGVALVYFLMSALIKWKGKKFLDRLFPPVVIGPVIIIIGLSLSATAVDMAKNNWLLAFISLITAIIVLTLAKGMLKLVPVVCGIIVGYVVAVGMGLIDFTPVREAPWLALPQSIAHFQLPHLAWEPFVFMIPVACELDLKKAASTVDEKSIAMIKAKELLPLTGYVHGGCSPVGMKTRFRTCIDETAQLYDTIMFSGGRIGCQVEMAPDDLDALVDLTFADLTM